MWQGCHREVRYALISLPCSTPIIRYHCTCGRDVIGKWDMLWLAACHVQYRPIIRHIIATCGRDVIGKWDMLWLAACHVQYRPIIRHIIATCGMGWDMLWLAACHVHTDQLLGTHATCGSDVIGKWDMLWLAACHVQYRLIIRHIIATCGRDVIGKWDMLWLAMYSANYCHCTCGTVIGKWDMHYAYYRHISCLPCTCRHHWCGRDVICFD